MKLFAGATCSALESRAGCQDRPGRARCQATAKQFAWLVPHFRGLTTGSLLIAGEVCALDSLGRPDFSLLKLSLDGRSPLVFMAFDLLEQDGEDLTALPLLGRKGRLSKDGVTSAWSSRIGREMFGVTQIDFTFLLFTVAGCLLSHWLV